MCSKIFSDCVKDFFNRAEVVSSGAIRFGFDAMSFRFGAIRFGRFATRRFRRSFSFSFSFSLTPFSFSLTYPFNPNNPWLTNTDRTDLTDFRFRF